MSAAIIQFYNRYTGLVDMEAVYGEKALRFTYENPLGKAALHTLVKRAAFSEWYGRSMDSPASKARIGPFIDKYLVDVSEFADPPERFATFNDFFYRKLKPEARPIVADPTAAALPADGRHLVIPQVAGCRDFYVKGVCFNLPALLEDEALAARFAGGSLIISRLCPVDYHRFHFPCAGVPDEPRLIHGPLYSVSPIALMRRPSILWENKRYVTRLKSEVFGEVLIVEIGATCVGSVVHTHEPHQPAAKGAEKGYFRFGGSCLVTVFEPGRMRFAADLLEQSAKGLEVYARMGDLAGWSAG
jgi:phosphatidylserine decarboxylase